jgi:hypothetical protein
MLKLYVVEVFVTHPYEVNPSSDWTFPIMAMDQEAATKFAEEQMEVDYPTANRLPGQDMVYQFTAFTPSDKPGVLQTA